MTEELNVWEDIERVIEPIRVPHPWRRYFARSVDLSLYSIIWLVISLLILRWNPKPGILHSILSSYINWGLMLLIEPILLSTIGTTLGKWIFGLVLRDLDGRKLTYKQSVHRTFGVFGSGMGYNIPIYAIVRSVKSFGVCEDGRMLSWDEDIHYTIKDKKVIRPIGFIAIVTALTLLAIFINLQGNMPKHRGDLTAEQYIENCNDIMKYNNIEFGKDLNEQGQWVDREFDAAFTINDFSQPLPDHLLTITDGFVTGVTLEVEKTNEEWISGYNNHLSIAVLSFVAAQDGMSGIQLQKSHILEKLENGLKYYSFTEAGIRITNKVEFRGYEFAGSYLFPKEGEEQYFHMVFTMEKEKHD